MKLIRYLLLLSGALMGAIVMPVPADAAHTDADIVEISGDVQGNVCLNSDPAAAPDTGGAAAPFVGGDGFCDPLPPASEGGLNGLPGPNQACAATQYQFDSVLITGTIAEVLDNDLLPATNVLAAGTLPVDGVTGSSTCEKETRGSGTVCAGDTTGDPGTPGPASECEIVCTPLNGAAIDLPTTVDSSIWLDGAFHGRFVREATEVWVGLDVDYTVWSDAGCAGTALAGSPRNGLADDAPTVNGFVAGGIPGTVIATFIPTAFDTNTHPKGAVFQGTFVAG